MSVSTWNQDRIDWRRVGALSATFNVHILAGAALLLATVQLAPSLSTTAPPPMMQVEVIEPVTPLPEPPIIEREVEPDLAPVTTPVRTDRTEATATVPQPQATSVATPMAIALPPPSLPMRPALSMEPANPDRGVAYERVRQPLYPPDARARGIEGETVLRVLVGSDGRVLEVSLNRSSGDRRLDRAAETAVRSWRFSPAIQNGQAVTAWVQIPISFRIDRH